MAVLLSKNLEFPSSSNRHQIQTIHFVIDQNSQDIDYASLEAGPVEQFEGRYQWFAERTFGNFEVVLLISLLFDHRESYSFTYIHYSTLQLPFPTGS
jgi:hypothetical protein